MKVFVTDVPAAIAWGSVLVFFTSSAVPGRPPGGRVHGAKCSVSSGSQIQLALGLAMSYRGTIYTPPLLN